MIRPDAETEAGCCWCRRWLSMGKIVQSGEESMQTKTQSLTESVTNVAIGYAVAIASQLAIFPIFGIDIGIQQNLLIGAYFTAISIVRSYCVRRWFNASSRKK